MCLAGAGGKVKQLDGDNRLDGSRGRSTRMMKLSAGKEEVDGKQASTEVEGTQTSAEVDGNEINGKEVEITGEDVEIKGKEVKMMNGCIKIGPRRMASN